MHAITFLDSTRNSAQIIAKHFEEGFKDSSFVCSSQSPVFGDAALDTISSSLTRLCFFLLQSCLS
ncbi:MAG: hypothetical protein ACK5YS_03610, partial [bacterium]